MNPSVVEHIYATYWHEVFACLRSKVLSDAEAEDLCQVSFLAIMNAYEELRPGTVKSLWIKTALNKWRDQVRHTARRAVEPLELVSISGIPYGYDMTEQVATKELVRKAWFGLHTWEQMLLYYHDIIGLENDLIVQTIEARLGPMPQLKYFRQRLCKARQHFRELYAKFDV